jgi:nicotinate-nucleotide adenylyltransferase
MKIGILGGTFDPPHFGHLAAARAAREELGLDEVMLIPAHRNPLKAGRTSPPALRLRMSAHLAALEPWLSVSDIEISRGGRSYMIETLRDLLAMRPASYWLILGGDAYRRIPEWREPERLAQMARFAVLSRGRETADWARQFQSRGVREATDLIPGDMPDISSTIIRRIAADGLEDERLAPPSIWQTIRKERLYRDHEQESP